MEPIADNQPVTTSGAGIEASSQVEALRVQLALADIESHRQSVIRRQLEIMQERNEARQQELTRLLHLARAGEDVNVPAVIHYITTSSSRTLSDHPFTVMHPCTSRWKWIMTTAENESKLLPAEDDQLYYHLPTRIIWDAGRHHIIPLDVFTCSNLFVLNHDTKAYPKAIKTEHSPEGETDAFDWDFTFENYLDYDRSIEAFENWIYCLREADYAEETVDMFIQYWQEAKNSYQAQDHWSAILKTFNADRAIHYTTLKTIKWDIQSTVFLTSLRELGKKETVSLIESGSLGLINTHRSGSEGKESADNPESGPQGRSAILFCYACDLEGHLAEKCPLQKRLGGLINPQYMDDQVELTWKMRGILVQWMIKGHGQLNLIPETLYLAVNILDRFFSVKTVSIHKLIQAGMTVLYIAATYEEDSPPSVNDLQTLALATDEILDSSTISRSSDYITRSLRWNISYVNPLGIYKKLSNVTDYNPLVQALVVYLLEITLLIPSFLSRYPTLTVSATIWLSHLVLEKDDCILDIRRKLGHDEEEIVEASQDIIVHVRNCKRKYPDFYTKFSAKEFLKAAIFMHTWTTDIWPETDEIEVDLKVYIHRLRQPANSE